jgi:hypothetical protein
LQLKETTSSHTDKTSPLVFDMAPIEHRLDKPKQAINKFEQNHDCFREQMASLFNEVIQPALQDASDCGTVRLPSKRNLLSFMMQNPDAYSPGRDQHKEEFQPSVVSQWAGVLSNRCSLRDRVQLLVHG